MWPVSENKIKNTIRILTPFFFLAETDTVAKLLSDSVYIH